MIELYHTVLAFQRSKNTSYKVKLVRFICFMSNDRSILPALWRWTLTSNVLLVGHCHCTGLSKQPYIANSKWWVCRILPWTKNLGSSCRLKTSTETLPAPPPAKPLPPQALILPSPLLFFIKNNNPWENIMLDYSYLQNNSWSTR